MRKPLQDFGDSQYERPQCAWICGLAEEGHDCPAGPTAHGRCPALPHCAPRRNGDRWECNRSPLRGGPCEGGPGPDGECSCIDRCHPARSLRSRRGRFVIACGLFTLGVLLMTTSGEWRSTALKPGPLAQNHAQILADRSDSQRCATCHEAAGGGIGTWLAATVWHPEGMATQSQLCLECHRDMLPGEVAMVAHNVPPDRLRELTAARTAGSLRLVSATFGSPTNRAGEIACSQCHREHQGGNFDLTSISNAACQACHTERYDHFAGDHPDFGLWPYERRTRIVFDHAAHQGKHFPKENANFDCARCHVDDSTHEVKLLAGYEASCAACHDQSIAASLGTGVPIFALPTIDVESLTSAGIRVREWPEAATGDFDGWVPPWMKLLLAADPATAAAMAELGAGFEFADVDPDDPAQVRAAAVVIAECKKLLGEMAQSGRQVAADRLSRLLVDPGMAMPPDLLLAGLSADIARGAHEKWFPGGTMAATSATPTRNELGRAAPLALSPAGTWQRNDQTLSIEYRPAGHADPLLTSWLNLVVSAAGERDNPPLATALKELAGPTAAGQCITCHSMEGSDSGLVVNWRALRSEDKRRDFTRFTHRPHLIQPELADCTHCHQVDATANTSVSYNGRDPHAFVSDFLPVTKGQCAECHTPHAAGDRCQSCHNYHVQGQHIEAAQSRRSSSRGD